MGVSIQETANIDADPSINLNNRAGLIPIGNTSAAFTGKYNGQGFWIDDLHINRSSSNEIGLFGVVNGAEIINVKLFDANIKGSTRVGAIAGDITGNSTLSSITIDSSVGVTYCRKLLVSQSSNMVPRYLAYSGTVSGIIKFPNSTGHNVEVSLAKCKNNHAYKELFQWKYFGARGCWRSCWKINKYIFSVQFIQPRIHFRS